MWYDAVILAVLVLATLRGAAKGFVWQLASIAALILCFAFAGSGSALIAPHIRLEPPLNRWVTMLALYVVCSFASFGAARLLHGWIEKAKFVEFDRHLGSLFGFVKGVVFSLVLTFFVVTLSDSVRGHVLESRSGYAAAIIMDRLHPVMPAELHDVLEPYIHQLDRPGLDLRHARHADGARHGEHDHAASGGAADAKSLERLLSEIPALIDRELKARVLTALEQTSPEDRARWLEDLRNGAPAALATLLAEGQAGGVVPTSGTSSAANVNPTRSSLVHEIVAVYSDVADARSRMAAEIEAAVAGLPERVVRAVLEDWRADLLLKQPDPDPSTDVATTLDGRIVRQLRLAGVPLESLGRGLRDRLESVPR